MGTNTLTSAVDVAEQLQFRTAMGRFPTGVTIVTGLAGSEPVGFTCQSFISLSLDPLLVSVSVMNTSTTYPRIRESGRFSVNFLSAEMRALSNQFARSLTDKWAGVEWSLAQSRSPILEGAVAWVDCDIDAEHVVGDHTLVVGRVRNFGAPEGANDPLVFHSGQYRDLVPTEAA